MRKAKLLIKAIGVLIVLLFFSAMGLGGLGQGGGERPQVTGYTTKFHNLPYFLDTLSNDVLKCPEGESCNNYEEEAAKVLISYLLTKKGGRWLWFFLLKESVKKLIFDLILAGLDDLEKMAIKVVAKKITADIGKTIDIIKDYIIKNKFQLLKLGWKDIGVLPLYLPYNTRYKGIDGEALMIFYSPYYIPIKEIKKQVESGGGLFSIYVPPTELREKLRQLPDDGWVRPFRLTIRGTVLYEFGEIIKRSMWKETIHGPYVTFFDYPDSQSQAPIVSAGTYADYGGTPNDPRDCLAIQVSRGQKIRLELSGPRGTDFDLWVYKPGSNFASWESVNDTSQELIDINSAPETGRYVICISFASGSGVWKLEIRMESGVRPPPPPSQPPATPTSPPPRPSLRGATTASALVMDVSSSMGWTWQGEVKLESAKRVASQTINLIEEEARASGAGHSLAIVSFSDQANLLLPLTNNYRQAKGVVLSLRPEASTNLGAGLQMALAELARAPAGSQKYIILLSDGHITSGMGEAEVLAGPVAQARQRKICIHTVGFGDPNYLKEDFLKEISQQSGCGKHLYAKNSFELTKAYIKLRHLSLGGSIAEFVSQAKIYEGETLTLGAVSLPGPRTGQEIEELHFTLTWPGSRLQPRLFDPTGVEVTEGYPGAQIAYFEQFAHVVVRQPQPGFWRVVIFGEEVPSRGSDFYAVLSTRPGKLAAIIPLINPVVCTKSLSGEEQCRYLLQGNIPTWRIIIGNIATMAVLAVIVAVVVYLRLSGQTP